ncbi:uncharacterized protein METZ01_LOCUS228528 [marine metagenome]|uniref:Uncharacterized protein n=1 Tax=marine metagenome TaxID=408172 RepID=A0A382GLK4_9ZZZZ
MNSGGSFLASSAAIPKIFSCRGESSQAGSVFFASPVNAKA